MLKKLLAVMFLFVMAAGVFSQSIPSGTGRYAALGNSPFILDASSDIFSNPAWNTMYRNYAFGDLTPMSGNDFNGNAGVTFAIGKKWNLGMIINKRQDSWSLFYIDVISPRNSPIVPFMGLIGYTASKNFQIALAPYVSMGNNEFTDTTGALSRKYSSRSIGANLGFIYTLKKGWVEGAFRFRMNKFENDSSMSGGSQLDENDGGIELGAGFRGWIYPSKSSKIAVVPFLGFFSYSFQPKSTITVGTTSTAVTGLNYSWLNINAGVGLNWPIMDDIQIAGGVGLAYNTYKADTGSYEFKSTEFVAPAFNMAMETRITDWITARLGFNKSITMGKYENTYQEAKSTFGSPDATTISMGTGFHFGRFSIDATINERWFKSGPNFLSGNSSSSNEMFGDISASYYFGK